MTRADQLDATRERHARWFALVMDAAAALEDAARCLHDEDAKRLALSAARYYRESAKSIGEQ